MVYYFLNNFPCKKHLVQINEIIYPRKISQENAREGVLDSNSKVLIWNMI